MDGLAGLLVLVGLAVLAVPVLLVIALVSLSGVKSRVNRLEAEVAALRRQAQSASVSAAPRADAAAERAAAEMETEPDDAPTLQEILRQSAQAPESPIATPSTQAPEGEAPSETPSAAVPPPLPPRPAPTPVPRPIAQAAPRPAARTQSETATPSEAPAYAQRAAPPPRAPASPDIFTTAFRAVKRWFTVGNVPVKIGVLVLFAGVAALLKYATDQGWLSMPIELRLAAISAAALAALVFAWRKRESHRSFALSLQGGAIGILLLTVFAAFKRFDLLEAGPAFGISVVLIFGAGALAVLQNAKALAVFAVLAGFLAPIWLSTGSGNHVALFSYYAVLNAAILGVAWWKPWRVLNLMGFAFTFGIGALWGAMSYEPSKFNSTEPFLLLFFAFYLIIPLLYARRMPEGRRGLIDACLLFGTPLIAFSLQACLLDGARLPLGFNALGLAAIYVVLAAVLRKRSGYEALVSTYAVLAVGFATLAVPLALSARATACVFALEGAAMIWLGVRQSRVFPQLAGSALQLLAAGAFLLGDLHAGASAIINPVFMAALIIAIAGFASAWVYKRENSTPAVVFYLWGLSWWVGNAVHETYVFVGYVHNGDVLLAFAALTGWLAAEVHRRHSSGALALTTLLALAAAAPLAVLQVDAHAQPFAGYGVWAWLVYALLGVRSLICLRSTEHPLAGSAQFVWWLVWPLAVSLLMNWICTTQSLAEGWRWLAILSPWLVLTAIGQFRWSWLSAPLGERFDGYRMGMQLVQFAIVGMFGLYGLLLAGSSAPLPWVPVLNPLELGQLIALVLLVRWLWSEQAPDVLRSQRVALLSALGFAWITVVVLRGVHHWGGVPWDAELISSKLAQTSLTVAWSVLGVIGWVMGSRRGQRMLWLAGAVLMGVVLVKLLLVDRGNLGDVLGIASFIAYGLLCTVVGYFAPVPPRAVPQDANA